MHIDHAGLHESYVMDSGFWRTVTSYILLEIGGLIVTKLHIAMQRRALCHEHMLQYSLYEEEGWSKLKSPAWAQLWWCLRMGVYKSFWLWCSKASYSVRPGSISCCGSAAVFSGTLLPGVLLWWSMWGGKLIRSTCRCSVSFCKCTEFHYWFWYRSGKWLLFSYCCIAILRESITVCSR